MKFAELVKAQEFGFRFLQQFHLRAFNEHNLSALDFLSGYFLRRRKA